MRLRELLTKVEVTATVGPINVDIVGITFDSRTAGPGFRFVVRPGGQTDGHDFVDAVTDAGVAAVLCQRLLNEARPGAAYV
jgi:UDP-N-acetylmuramoyl-L-alanyl-D-glutamate--2,6-diaminopimelate ligase